jgi:hypothetical protein
MSDRVPTYTAFRSWSLKHPNAQTDDVVKAFPKNGFHQLLAWMARFNTEMTG